MTEPRPGDFGLTQISGDAGRLIRVGQWLNGDGFADYEHAFILVEGGSIVEAEPGGARIAAVSEYRDILWSSNLDFGGCGLNAAERHRIVMAAMGYVGTPYSAADYFALAAHRLHLPLPALKRYVADSRHMICSQLVDQCYQDAGVRLFADGRWPGYCTPAALADLLRQKAGSAGGGGRGR